MNFNIIAPTKNCSDFNVSFKEPIVIDKDSKIQFNWAKFSRQNGIVLETDAEFFVKPLDGIPKRVPNNPATLTLNRGNDRLNKFIIKAGRYSAYTFQNAFINGINSLISADYASPHPPTNGWNTQYYLEHLPLKNGNNDGTDLFFGLIYTNDDDTLAPALDWYGGNQMKIVEVLDNANGKNFHYNFDVVDGEIQSVYEKQANEAGRTANTYDNYAMSSAHLWHYGEAEITDITGGGVGADSGIYPFQEDIFKGKRGFSRMCAFSAKALKNLDEISQKTFSAGGNENIAMGLYSREWATSADVNAGTDKTAGAGNTCADGATLNPATTNPDNPAQCLIGFLTIEVGEYHQASVGDPPIATFPGNDYVMIRVANKGNGVNDDLKNMIPTDPIAGMTLLSARRISHFTSELGYVPEIQCAMYYRKNPNYDPVNPPTDVDRDSTAYLDEDLLYFRVGFIINNEETNYEDTFVVFYDSHEQNIGFSQRFMNHFENTLGAGQTADQVNMAIPFNLILSAQCPEDGWQRIKMLQIPKEQIGYNYNDNPITILRGYQLDMPEFIGRMINPFDNDLIQNERFLSKILYPTHQSQVIYGAYSSPAPWNIYIEDITARFRFSDISIFLDSLPLENYKNIEGRDTRNNVKGLKKNLLANCPQPFADGNVVGSSISGFYSPFSNYITQMKNQNLKTNNLRILIKDSNTDKPNTELETATIDFTIFK